MFRSRQNSWKRCVGGEADPTKTAGLFNTDKVVHCTKAGCACAKYPIMGSHPLTPPACRRVWDQTPQRLPDPGQVVASVPCPLPRHRRPIQQGRTTDNTIGRWPHFSFYTQKLVIRSRKPCRATARGVYMSASFDSFSPAVSRTSLVLQKQKRTRLAASGLCSSE